MPWEITSTSRCSAPLSCEGSQASEPSSSPEAPVVHFAGNLLLFFAAQRSAVAVVHPFQAILQVVVVIGFFYLLFLVFGELRVVANPGSVQAALEVTDAGDFGHLLALLVGQKGCIARAEAVHATLEVLNAMGAGNLLLLEEGQSLFVAVGNPWKQSIKLLASAALRTARFSCGWSWA